MTRVPLASSRLAGVPRGRGVMLFTFDDVYSDWSTDLIPLANKYGHKVTLAVESSRIDNVNGTAAQVASWYSQGHEIAAHSVTHPLMAGSTQANRIIEMDNSKAIIEGIIGAGNCRTWVYPVGGTTARNATTDAELWGRYDRVLDAGIAYTGNTPYVTGGGLNSPFVLGRMPWGGAQQKAVLDLIRRLAVSSSDTIASVYAHSPQLDPTWTWAMCDAAFALAASLGVPCLTAREALPAGPLQNPSFEADGAVASITAIGDVTGWTPYLSSNTASIVAVTPDTSLAIAGGYALQLNTDYVGAGSPTPCIVYQDVPVKPNTSYTFSGRVQHVAGTQSGSGEARMRMRTLSYDGVPGSWTGASANSALATIGQWVKGSVAYTTGANERVLRLECYSDNQTGLTTNFDHLWFGPTALGDFG